MNFIKQWWAKKQYAKAVKIINGYGLTVARMYEVAGTTYIQNNEGQLFKLNKANRSNTK